MHREIFITGGKGYLGKRLIPRLTKTGYNITALVRAGSAGKLSGNCIPITADPFDAESFKHKIPADYTFIQLLGVPHPCPSKKHMR